MEHLNLGDLVGQAYGSHKHYSVSSIIVLCSLVLFYIICSFIDVNKHWVGIKCARFSIFFFLG